jgi:hypothetical protein
MATQKSSTGGYTPFTQAVNASSAYAITAQDGGAYVFDHWQDGSANRTKMVAPSSDVTLTAYYRTPSAILTVKSADQSGDSLDGMYMTVTTADGKTQSGYSNMTYAGSVGGVYTETASDYYGLVFSHWQDGLTSRTRNVMLLSGNTELTAYYNTGGAQWGLTPLTLGGLQGPPGRLTINATSLEGRPLHMWSVASPQSDGSYIVTIHNYQGYTFSHWENGSTNSTRIVGAGQKAITAFFVG